MGYTQVACNDLLRKPLTRKPISCILHLKATESKDKRMAMKPTYGSIIKEKRQELGLTQQEVAKAVGIGTRTYYRYEDGSLDIMKASFDVVCSIVLFLGMDVLGFYHGEYLSLDGLEETEKGMLDEIELWIRSNKYDVEAEGMYGSLNHITVMAGSRVSHDSNLAEKGWKRAAKLRQVLIEKGIIRDRTFTQDYEFGNPSEAASVICGRHLSGNDMWRTEDGVKLGELLKKGEY